MKGSKANIRRVLNAADETDISEGRLSYFRYNEVLKNLAEFYRVDFARAVAVFCALSPNNEYKGNLRSAASVLKGFTEGVEVGFIRVTTYNHCRDRAFEYLNGSVEFEDPDRGKKILSFYRNILNPMDPEPVTIDGHAVNIWRGHPAALNTVNGFNYEAVAKVYREIAKEYKLLPNQVQSITWFAWKRIHNIGYPGRQLHLFRDNSADLWETLQDPESIETFPYFTEPTATKYRKTQKHNGKET